MGLGIAIGTGLGIIFREMVFGEFAIGIAVGASTGVAFGSSCNAIANYKSEDQ